VSNVVSLDSRRPPKPPEPDRSDRGGPGCHAAGAALCLACGHKWIATAPIGTFSFDCTRCSGTTGVWAAPFCLPQSSVVYACRCGCQHFAAALTQGAWWLMCRQCGQGHDLEKVMGVGD
jgi:hypothetical protein